MTGINEIQKAALELGACDKVNDIKTIGDAVKLLMSPQGREFAIKTGFPSLETWRANADAVKATRGVWLDRNNVYACNQECLFVGDTEATAEFIEPDVLHHVVAMHGAKVKVVASKYAVVMVSSINATVEVESDNTAIVYVEESHKKGGSE